MVAERMGQVTDISAFLLKISMVANLLETLALVNLPLPWNVKDFQPAGGTLSQKRKNHQHILNQAVIV